MLFVHPVPIKLADCFDPQPPITQILPSDITDVCPNNAGNAECSVALYHSTPFDEYHTSLE
jgi:hypothetical protein